MSTYLNRSKEWSFKTFGSPADGRDHKGALDHIKKELLEIEANPADAVEWIDVLILAVDAMTRAGCPDHFISGAFYTAKYPIAGNPVQTIRAVLDWLESSAVDLPETPVWRDLINAAMTGYYVLDDNSCVEVLTQMFAKQRKNFNRDWPDWRNTEPGKAIEHVKGTHD